jgi:hypothetical protein
MMTPRSGSSSLSPVGPRVAGSTGADVDAGGVIGVLAGSPARATDDDRSAVKARREAGERRMTM